MTHPYLKHLKWDRQTSIVIPATTGERFIVSLKNQYHVDKKFESLGLTRPCRPTAQMEATFLQGVRTGTRQQIVQSVLNGRRDIGFGFTEDQIITLAEQNPELLRDDGMATFIPLLTDLGIHGLIVDVRKRQTVHSDLKFFVEHISSPDNLYGGQKHRWVIPSAFVEEAALAKAA